MCGIFGFYNYRQSHSHADIIDILLTGLRRLEYRGYDSAGLAVDTFPVPLVVDTTTLPSSKQQEQENEENNSRPLIIKACGKISDLETQVKHDLSELKIDGNVEFEVHAGIAHTRWATHGPPSVVNAHPHTSGAGEGHEFLVVHNGIITNFRALKDFLVHHGETFESETDTEVIPKLFKWIYNSLSEPVTFSQLVMDVMSQLEGAYALLVKSTHYPGEMVACKRGSPLIMGVKKPSTSSTGTGAEPALVNDGGDQKENGNLESPAAAGGGDGLAVGPRDNPAAKRRPGVEYFLASDASAVVEHTKRVVVLEDGDVVVMRRGTYEIFNFGDGGGGGSGLASTAAAAASAPLPRALQTLNMEVSSIMKGGYDHFMLKEIFEQPETVLQTMRGRVRFRQDAPAAEVAAAAGSPVAWTLNEAGNNNKIGGITANATIRISATTPTKPNGYSLPPPPEIKMVPPAPAASVAVAAAAASTPKEERIKLGGLAEHIETIRTGRRLIFVACGTSFHACLAARQALEHLVGIPVAMELASDLLDRAPPIFRDDTCVFVSQSGETADTLRALEYARAKGALCVGLTNTVGSAIARNTHAGVHINAGCEIGVASTKAYTSQIVVMVMMALALSADRVSQQAHREEIIDGLGQLPCALRAALRLDTQVRDLATRLKDEQSLLVFGRGYNYATALEAALKVKEVTLMHSEGILAGEMKHGPLALVDEHMPILVVATLDSMHGKMLSVIQQLKARGARLVVLCCEGDNEVEHAAGKDAVLVRVPKLPDCLQPVVNAVPLQLLAYHLAVLRGHNVDQPRNLAKSVTTCE